MIQPLLNLFKRWTALENPNRPIDGAALDDYGVGWQSKAGQTVSAKRALTLSPVWQAVSMISGDISKMPLELFKKVEVDGRERRILDKSHPAFTAVARMANESQHSMKVWRRLMVHVLIWNQGYLWIKREGRRIKLYNLLPDRTYLDPESTDTSPGGLYFTDMAGELQALYPSEVFHVEGISFGAERVHELELVRQARDAWGIALATQDFKGRFYKNGAMAGGLLEIPAHFTEKAAANLEEGFRKRQSAGSDNWFKAVILRDGAKFHQTTVDPEKQQLSQATEDQVMDVARWFNLQPSKLGVRSATSYGSKAEDNQSYFDQSLSHWCQTISAEAFAKLLTTEEQLMDSHEFCHNNRALVANDAKTRAEVGEIESRMGAITVNEYRASTGRNPVEGGDLRTIPMNQYIVDQEGHVFTPDVVGQGGQPDEQEPQEDQEEAARTVLLEACHYQIQKAASRVKKEVSRKAPANFLSWWDKTRATLLADFSEAVMAPAAVYRHVTGTDMERQVARTIERLARGVDSCLDSCLPGELEQAVKQVCDEINPSPFEETE